ncbi:thiamine pyrophosphate-binding protein [Blastococcus saxobsidens]|uniref:Acetolactate synthase-1/2/3 large subunit n=1 Tax=Blastococcus saxobsidens TaxID=138336 RepID=A0A4V2G1X1_9ACTN|nr:thiamine pyrophosphate-binding protein [Blastococcus saxobsidens]RZU30826.1 acetolactate synthase-1/2/3 large subunit [Blastococcus saxobsidens]
MATQSPLRTDEQHGRTGADLVVACLAAEGIRVVAGVPGTTVMDVIDSLRRQERVRFVVTRHEQVAGFLADGMSRGGAAPGVALVSRGPGAANLSIAVQNAYDESIPMLVLVGQVPGGISERRAFEEMDVVGTFRPMTKWVVEVHDVARIPELLQRAVRTSVSGRPGPVVVSLPLDVLQAAPPEGLGPAPRRRSHPPAPAPAAIEEAVAILAGAERPVVVLGGGARGDASVYLQLADRLGAPLVTTWMRQSVVSHDAPAYLGALGYGAHEVTERTVREADALLALGCRFSEFTTKRWTLVPEETRLVHVDVDPTELGRVYVPDVGITSDAGLATAALLDRLPAAGSGPRDARRRALRDEYLQVSSLDSEDLTTADEPGTGVSGISAIRVLQSLADRPGIRLLQDAPSFAPWTHRYLRLSRPNTLHASAGGAMAWGLPAAMGIALARPEERLVTVSGDGSFWMVAQDFETCVREGIQLVNLVMNNFSYGNTRDRQRMAHGGRYLGVFYNNPDFAGFARSLGGFGVRVERDEDLASAVEEALAQERPAIIDVIQDQMYGLPPGLTPLAAR